jgi:hypothetical protein
VYVCGFSVFGKAKVYSVLENCQTKHSVSMIECSRTHMITILDRYCVDGIVCHAIARFR